MAANSPRMGIMRGIMAVVGLLLLGLALPCASAGHTRSWGELENVRQAYLRAGGCLLYSLEPLPRDGEKFEGKFHDWDQLGVTSVNQHEFHQIVGTLFTNLWAPTSPDQVRGCFEPRHGLRVKQGSHTLDIVICFSCEHAFVYRDEQKIGVLLVNDTPHAMLDDVLRHHGVQLARP